MGRFSPTVLPRARGKELADAFAQAAETFAQGMAQRQARGDAEKYRTASLGMEQQRLDLTRQGQADEQAYRGAALDRQRAEDARYGVIYDPQQQYGRGPARTLDLADALASAGGGASAAPLATQPMTLSGVRRPDLVDLGGGYTLDPARTPEGRKAAAETANQAQLADALMAGGLPAGVARAGAALPSALPYLVPKQADPLDPDRRALLRAQAAAALANAERDRVAAGTRGMSPAGQLNYTQDLARTYVGGIDGGDNPDATDLAQRGYANYLRDLPASDRSQAHSPEVWRAFMAEGQRIANGGAGALVLNLGSLQDLDRQRPGNRPSAPPANQPPVRQPGATSAPARLPAPAAAPANAGGYVRSPQADRWEQLVNGGMSGDEATAQVRREFGTP